MRYWFILLALCAPLLGAEKAAYDSNGRIMAMISDAGDVQVTSNMVAVLPTGKRVPLLVRRNRVGATRQGSALAWSINFALPDGGSGRIDWKAEEDDSGVKYSNTVTASSALDIEAIEFTLGLSRTAFAGGRLSAGGAPVTLANVRPAGGDVYRGKASALRFESAGGNTAVEIAFDTAADVAVVDRWDSLNRSFEVRAALLRGAVAAGATASLGATLRLKNQPPAPPAPVRLSVDASKARFHFDGFGANYCWNNQSPAAKYTLDNLKIAWGRNEMKAQQWDLQRNNPGPEIRADMEVMRRFQQMGAPYVISIWWLPERFYTDPYEKTRSTNFRLINPEKWDELLDLLGSYLLYAKREYGVEPDLFSFNEANRGVYVGLTPETHAQAIKKIGAYFQKIGLKTKMLLGDTTGMRDTHLFALDAVALMDAGAMQYVGAVGFHTWGGGTPEEYAAWGDVAEWLKLPLLVTELGVDGAGYYTRSWDSYHYGLREAQMTQELLRYARPQGTQYWQFTQDYSLVRTGAGGAVEPTSRFWLMKHFTDLTPRASDNLAAASDEKTVLVSAFRKGSAYTVHILNLGPARAATVEGLPASQWQVTETTEAAQFQKKPAPAATGGSVSLNLPARSLVTLTTQ
jgi:hypothetical protein